VSFYGTFTASFRAASITDETIIIVYPAQMLTAKLDDDVENIPRGLGGEYL